MELHVVPLSQSRTSLIGSIRKMARVRVEDLEQYRLFLEGAESILRSQGFKSLSTGFFVKYSKTIPCRIFACGTSRRCDGRAAHHRSERRREQAARDSYDAGAGA